MIKLLPLAAAGAVVLACNSPSKSADRQSQPTATAELVVRSESILRARFGKEVRHLLEARQYDSLEHLAAELRRPDQRWPNGGWRLRAFYYEGFDTSMDGASSDTWEANLQRLREWVRLRPSSITAPVALASALTGYAWEARGSGVGLTVSDSAASTMQSRLAEARAVLLEARKLPTVCPGWWAAAQRVALGEGWDRKTYESLFREAVQVEPTYDAYYDLKALHLLSRWYGSPGEWEAFADSTSARLPDPLGVETYARMVWYMQRYTEANIFKRSQASWEKTRLGFTALIRDYPSSLELKSAYAYLAWQANDRVTAARAFAMVGPQVDPGVWEDRDEFLRAKQWVSAP